jgi:hypothetical protein
MQAITAFLTSLVEFQTLYNGILYKNYSRRAVCFYTRKQITFINIHLYQALSATAGQFCASDQSNERGQMPDGAGMFSRQIPAYAGLTTGQIPGVRPGG